MRALIELLPLYLAMPGFAFGFGFGPQGGKSTTQGTYTPPSGTTGQPIGLLLALTYAS